ncbi:MAG TPA: hypothetical protein DD706_01390 [Nitrospiraceae bacterium]|nr:hypothetical protein [Nitrospiraceae bacterium]
MGGGKADGFGLTDMRGRACFSTGRPSQRILALTGYPKVPTGNFHFAVERNRIRVLLLQMAFLGPKVNARHSYRIVGSWLEMKDLIFLNWFSP